MKGTLTTYGHPPPSPSPGQMHRPDQPQHPPKPLPTSSHRAGLSRCPAAPGGDQPRPRKRATEQSPSLSTFAVEGLCLPASTPLYPDTAPRLADWARENHRPVMGTLTSAGARGPLTASHLQHGCVGNLFKANPRLFSPLLPRLRGNQGL